MAPRGLAADDALSAGWIPCEISLLAERVGERLELSKDEVRAVSLGTLLVELSKQAVTEPGTKKPDTLDAHEWRVIRHRARRAASLLAGANHADVRAVIDGCCEQWDGSGSPQGLAAEAIPVGARILALCDAFCARTSALSCSPSRALHELQALAGTRFDPACVRALVSIIR